MPRVPRRALAIAATAALATLGLSLGAGAAYAGDVANECTPVQNIEFATSGGFWAYVCPQTGELGEAGTPHKNDPFDGIGVIALGGVPINVPAGNETTVTAGSTTTITYTDVDVDAGGGDLVDIQVVREFGGSLVQWTISVFDADDQSPRSDVPLSLEGNLGSDSSTVFTPAGSALVSSGDPADPIVISHVDATTYVINTAGDSISFDFTSAVTTITVGLVDYGCTPDDMDAAVVYATSIAPTLPTLFGQALVAPGSVFCSTAPSTIYLAPGQPFSVTIPVSYTSTMDFGPNGALIYDWVAPGWVDVVENDPEVPGVVPTLTIEGIAPASGSFLFSLDTAIYDDVNDEYITVAGNWITLVAGTDPGLTLAETGVDATPFIGGAALLGLLGAVLVARGRRTRESIG